MQLKQNPEPENPGNGYGDVPPIERDPDAVKRSLVSARNENPNATFTSAGATNTFGQQSNPYEAPDPFGPQVKKNPFENDMGGMAPSAPNPSPAGPVVYDHKKSLNPAFIVAPIIIVVALIIIIQTVRTTVRKNYTPGVLSGNTYTNEYFGFKAQFDSKYTVEGALFGGDTDTIKHELELGMSVDELGVYRNESAEALNITVHPLDCYYDGPTSEVKDDMEKYKDQYSQELTNSGYIVSDIEQDTMTIAGKTVSGYLINGKLEGGSNYNMSMAQFFIYKGNYCCVITSVSTSKGKAKLLISNNFSELD